MRSWSTNGIHLRSTSHTHYTLPHEQFAYRKQHSCEDLLVSAIDDWQHSLDEGKFVVAVFLDISKAFDSVNHQHLINELFGLGIGGKALDWFASYLTGRQQQVTTRSCSGASYFSNRGVPQGSVLGPTLFNLAVRQLPNTAISSKMKQFADDLSVYKCGYDITNIVQSVSDDIEIIQDFLNTRGLNLNPSKTQLIVFRPQRSHCFSQACQFYNPPLNQCHLWSILVST